MVGHKRIPSREGGVEIVVEELATRMAAQGHAVTCYNRGGHHVSGAAYDGERLSEYKGVRLKNIPTIDKKGLAAVSASSFGCLWAAFGRYDVVHIHSEGPAAFCWMPKMLGKRVVMTVHGLDWARAKWKGTFGEKFILYGEKMAVKHADEIIVLNQAHQRYFQETYQRKTTFIPNGVNRPQRVPAEVIREKWGLEKDGYILYLGRIVPEKGEQYLCEAYRKLRTEKKLVFAGGASDSAEYFEQLKAQAKDCENMIFTDFVQGREREELFSNAYLFVLPSDLEGMPLGLMEAMSYGNCVVASDIPECADVVEDHGVTFRRGDAEDLRRVLQELCDQPEKVRQYQARAADFICKKYPWDQITAQTLKLYARSSAEKA